jgi:hypothetical protein
MFQKKKNSHNLLVKDLMGDLEKEDHPKKRVAKSIKKLQDEAVRYPALGNLDPEMQFGSGRFLAGTYGAIGT